MIEQHWKFIDEEQAQKICMKGFEYIIIPECDKQEIRSALIPAMKLIQSK